jgi:hypothetical protein
MTANVALLPDAGPLITLAYADALDLLCKPGWPIVLVDMVLHEVTRNQTPTSERLAQWAAAGQVPVRATRSFQTSPAKAGGRPRRCPQRQSRRTGNPGGHERLRPGPAATIRPCSCSRTTRSPAPAFCCPTTAARSARAPTCCSWSSRAGLASAAEIERRAIQAGRSFSRLRFPPD